jgi:hypothetical protein
LMRSSRGGCERGVHNVIFIAEDRGIIPLLGNFVRGASLCEAGDVVLNLCVEALTKFGDDVCTLEVAGLLHNLPETIDIPVNGDDTQPGNPNKTPKRDLFGITQVRGRLQFILNFHQSPPMTHQMLRRYFGRCKVISGRCKVISGSAKCFKVLQSNLTILLGEGKVDK